MPPETFPNDVSFIQDGRNLEIEAVEPGRRSNQISIGGTTDDTALVSEEDIQETDERIALIQNFLGLAEKAFKERGLSYPFQRASSGDTLTVKSDGQLLGQQAAELSELVGKGNLETRSAKRFERRAVEALHRMIGGWSVCTGAPRIDGTGCRRAIEAFRKHAEPDVGDYFADWYAPNGDLGADAIGILGKAWGGPVVFFQAKNTPFQITDIPEEFNRVSAVLHDWFGRRIGDVRRVIPVLAANTYLTRELKELAYRAAESGKGVHIVDAVDILYAENLAQDYRDFRDVLRIM